MKIHGIEVRKINEGQFSKVYLGKDGLIYHLIASEHCDYSKEAIYLWGQCEHSPEIERLENVHISYYGDWFYVFRMPRYFALKGKNKKIIEKIQDNWENHLRDWENWRLRQRKTAYEFVMKWFDNCLETLDIPDEIKESIVCIYDSVVNYGQSFLLEFQFRNVKQDKNGKIILLDIVFDVEKVD